MSLKDGNPTRNVRVAISSQRHQQHAHQVCRLQMEKKSSTPEQGTLAAASVGLSAATALYRLPPARGSRPGLPSGKWAEKKKKELAPLVWVGGSTKWNPVHPSSSYWMPQPPENEMNAWISAPVHKGTVSAATEAVVINTNFFFSAVNASSPAVP